MGSRFSAPVQTGPGTHPASCTIRTGSFLGIKSGRGVTLTFHHLLVPWSRKTKATPLLPLWAIRPLQSLSACTRAHFTLYLSPALYTTDLESISLDVICLPYIKRDLLLPHSVSEQDGFKPSAVNSKPVKQLNSSGIIIREVLR